MYRRVSSRFIGTLAHVHQLSNATLATVKIIEVQFGACLGDDYGRA
jgi:hypothetical protein